MYLIRHTYLKRGTIICKWIPNSLRKVKINNNNNNNNNNDNNKTPFQKEKKEKAHGFMLLLRKSTAISVMSTWWTYETSSLWAPLVFKVKYNPIWLKSNKKVMLIMSRTVIAAIRLYKINLQDFFRNNTDSELIRTSKDFD